MAKSKNKVKAATKAPIKEEPPAKKAAPKKAAPKKSSKKPTRRGK